VAFTYPDDDAGAQTKSTQAEKRRIYEARLAEARRPQRSALHRSRPADISKILTPDVVKIVVADAVKAAFAPIHDFIAKARELVERLERLEADEPPAPVFLRAQDRGSTVAPFVDLDPLALMLRMRREAADAIDGTNDPVLRAAYSSKIAQLDAAIASLRN